VGLSYPTQGLAPWAIFSRPPGLFPRPFPDVILSEAKDLLLVWKVGDGAEFFAEVLTAHPARHYYLGRSPYTEYQNKCNHIQVRQNSLQS